MVIGSESETVEFKLTTGEKNEAVEAMAAILNKHCRGTVYLALMIPDLLEDNRLAILPKRIYQE